MNLKIDKLKMLSCSLRKAAMIGFSAMALATLATSAQASLIVNGDFESIVNGSGGIGQFNNATYSTVTGWTSNGYNFVFASGGADTTGSTGIYGNLKLWGPNDGSANGLPASSPTGGNYIGADGAFQVGAISQTINGLTVGNSYVVSFYWAAAQQSGFNGANTEQWQVSLGGQTQSTAVASNVSHGFTGWTHEVFTYTATSSTEALSFLAVGTPTGVPPFALLDGVSVDPSNGGSGPAGVPEPGSLALVFGGLGLMGLGILRPKNWFKR